jgi:hypothetical protein
MEEFFKTIRLFHYLLIGLSLVMIVLALSPDLQSTYEAASDEITILRSLQMADYCVFAVEKVHSSRNEISVSVW